MSNLGITVSGFPELKAKIKELANDKDKKKEILLILRQVAKPTVLAVQFAAPLKKDWKTHTARGEKIKAGNLKRSIGIINSKLSNPTVFVGPKLKGAFKGWYGLMVDKGHNIYNNEKKYTVYKRKKTERTRSNLGRIRGRGINKTQGKVDPVNFIEKGYNVTKGQVTADAEKKVAIFIQRRINKLSN